MQVQRIQSTESIHSPSCKARFVYDRAGNFRNLWETSGKSSEFNSLAEQFSKIKNGVLEITNIQIGADYSRICTIFNNSTKKEKKLEVPCDRGCHHIENLINMLMEDMDFFKVSKRDNFVEKTHAAIPTFLKDQNGYFETLWANSQKSPEYPDKLAKFIEGTEKGSLEIYDMNKFTGGVHELFDSKGSRTGSEPCKEYDIINRKTGAYDHYIIPERVEYKLENLFDQIMARTWMRKPFEITEGYRNILGLK